MSSINQNNSNVNNNAQSSVQNNPQTQAPASTNATKQTKGLAAPSDSFAAAPGSAAANLLSSQPPVAAETKPANFQATLQAAKQKFAPYANNANPTATETAVIAKENKTPSKQDTMQQSREKQAKAQAASIISSAQESESHACGTKYTNHDANVKKMQDLGLTKNEAEAITRTLEDGRVPADQKNKLAYMLAATGMTGAGEDGVDKPIASNAAQVKGELATFGDAQAKAMGGAKKTVMDTGWGYLLSAGVAGIHQAQVANAMKNTGSRLDKDVAPDMSTPYQQGSTATSTTNTTVGQQDWDKLGVPPADQNNLANTSGISTETQTQASVAGVTLSRAQSNL